MMMKMNHQYVDSVGKNSQECGSGIELSIIILSLKISSSQVRKKSMGAVAGPLEYFQLYFDDAVIMKIVKETNRFARQYIQLKQATIKPPPFKSRPQLI